MSRAPVALVVAMMVSISSLATAQEFPAEFELSSLAAGDGSTGFLLNGVNELDNSAAGSAGDINGDGINDLIVIAPAAGTGGRTYVVFGRAAGGFPPEFELSSLAAGNGDMGFVLNGVGEGSRTFGATSGDINGDGIDDLFISAPSADPGGRDAAGQTYVVFGRTAAAGGFPPEFDLSTLATGDGSAGFVVNGAGGDQAEGRAAGDINGDGIDDLVVGARFGDPGGRAEAGETYVLFGRAAGNFPAQFELSTLAAGDGSAGFVLNGVDPLDNSMGLATGDINGDGIEDVLINAANGAPGGRSDAGETYVVFGRATTAGGFPAVFELASLAAGDGSTGFVVNGVDLFDHAGFQALDSGDFNGDGIDDLLIGAAEADPNGISQAGESYVVFGRDAAAGGFPAEIELSSLAGGDGSTGFVLNGVYLESGSGATVSAAGDVNGDGIDDLMIGAFGEDPGGRAEAGAIYVVFGRTAAAGGFPGEFELSWVAAGAGDVGFVMYGVDPNDQAGNGDLIGNSLNAAGDVNGDGIDDLIVGSRLADPDGRDRAGESYVVFGRPSGAGGGVGETGSYGAVGDYVWRDTDGDGIQDVAETGWSGVTLTLSECNGPRLGATKTDSDGNYQFSGLGAGSYQVGVVLPSNATFSPKGAGSDTERNSDVRPDLGTTWCTNITSAGEQRTTLDAGLVPAGGSGGGGSVGDYVWRDADGDGVQDSSESGWPGVMLSLRECNGPVIATTTTDSGGNYEFSGLGEGRYQVAVALPSGATFSPQAAGGDPNRNSDVRPDRATTWCANITSAGEQRTSLDVGLVPGGSNTGMSSLGDFVWNDLDGDGIQDDAEPGLARVKVKLRNCNGIYQQTTFSDGDGVYAFENLAAGNYLVHFIAPDGMTSSPVGQGSAGRDNNAGADGLSHCIALGTNDQRRGIDAGFH